jgi:DNA-directed RNA polymerase beta subunit
MYLGGKDGSRLYFGKPVIYDQANDQSDARAHYMYPNEARLRNMTYAMTIHYDVEIEFIDILEEGESAKPVAPSGIRFAEEEEEDEEEYENFKAQGPKEEEMEGGQTNEGQTYEGGVGKAPVKKPFRKPKIKRSAITPKETGEMREMTEKSMVSKNVQITSMVLEKVFLGRFPVMVQSDFCILTGMTPELRFQMGECRNDLGGYFIIDGKEKALIPQEKFADNFLDVKKESGDYLASATIRSVSENVAKPIRTLSMKIMAPAGLAIGLGVSGKFSNENIVVAVPNVRKPVPLFILFRALGII